MRRFRSIYILPGRGPDAVIYCRDERFLGGASGGISTIKGIDTAEMMYIFWWRIPREGTGVQKYRIF